MYQLHCVWVEAEAATFTNCGCFLFRFPPKGVLPIGWRVHGSLWSILACCFFPWLSGYSRREDVIAGDDEASYRLPAQLGVWLGVDI